MPIKALIKKLESLTPDAILRGVLEDPKLKQLIIDLNTEGKPTSQLFEQGVDARGVTLKSIGGDQRTPSGYAPSTIEGIPGRFEGKKQKGQRIDHITLKDTGDFYDSFTVKIGKDFIQIDADGQKSDVNLFKEWGPDLTGLTDQNLQILSDAIAEKIPEFVEQTLTS